MTNSYLAGKFVSRVGKMTLLTYQEVAKLGNCAVASVQRAEKSGTLQRIERDGRVGFDETDVQIWAYSRGDLAQVGKTIYVVSQLLDSHTEHLHDRTQVCLRSEKDLKQLFVDAIKQFLKHAFMMSEQTRYTYTESFELKDKQMLSRFECNVPKKLQRDLAVRFAFVLYVLLGVKLERICDKLGGGAYWEAEGPPDPGFYLNVDDFGLTSFEDFYETYFKC